MRSEGGALILCVCVTDEADGEEEGGKEMEEEEEQARCFVS